jgi:hypothetical protein
MHCHIEVIPGVSVARALYGALVLQMVQLAHIHGVIVVQGSLHSLGLERATTGSGFLDLLNHVEVGTCITSRGLRG